VEVDAGAPELQAVPTTRMKTAKITNTDQGCFDIFSSLGKLHAIIFDCTHVPIGHLYQIMKFSRI
jgi:hypothetical protein